MMLDREELTRKVAESYKMIISPDDPVLAFVAMNSVILEKYGSILTQSLQGESERSLVAFQVANKHLAASLKAEIERELSQAMHDFKRMHTEAYSQMHSALQEHINMVSKTREEATKAKNLAWIGAFTALLILIGTTIVGVFT